MKDLFFTQSLLSLSLLFSSSLAASDTDLEYKIKAGYLYNFTKFITWPEIKSPTFNLCIVGSDPFGEVIEPIQTKTAFNRAIKVIRLPEEDFLSNPPVPHDCPILFIGKSGNGKRLSETVQGLANLSGTLVVGDNGETITGGEMINFVNRDGKIKLQIDLQSVKRGNLKISAKLLEVAEIFRETPHE